MTLAWSGTGRSFDEAELQDGRGLMMSFTRAGSSMPGSWMTMRLPLSRSDDRLGDAEGVDAVADRFDGVLDRVALDGRDRCRLHLEQHRPFGRTGHVPRAEEVFRNLLVIGGGDTGRRGGQERKVVDAARHERRKVDLLRLGLERLGRLIGLQTDGVADR